MNEEETLQQQKANCIFCRIIKGEVPAKKVYEDDKVIAILDINPAVRGHVLVLPKEHYPILPLIPFDQMQALFKTTRALAGSLKEAVLCPHVTIFIANGAAAGQQSPHFLYHLIPREENDGLLALPLTGPQEENDGLAGQLAPRLGGLMSAYLRQVGRAPPPLPVKVSKAAGEPPTEVSVTEERLEKLIGVINANDELKEALINRPEEVKEAARTLPKWRELFAGIDIDKLSQNLRTLATANIKRQAEGGAQKGPDLDKISELI